MKYFCQVRDFHKYCNGMAKQQWPNRTIIMITIICQKMQVVGWSVGRAGVPWGRGSVPLYLLDDNCDNIRTLARRNCRCLKIDDLNL